MTCSDATLAFFEGPWPCTSRKGSFNARICKEGADVNDVTLTSSELEEETRNFLFLFLGTFVLSEDADRLKGLSSSESTEDSLSLVFHKNQQNRNMSSGELAY